MVSREAQRRWALSYRVLFALVSVATLALVQRDRSSTITLKKSQLVGLIILVAVVALIDQVKGAIGRYKAPTREKAYARVQKALVGAMVTLTEGTAVPLPDLGASVWVVRRRGLGWTWKPLGKVLSRDVRFRLTDHPQASRVMWTSGKGAIGRAWQERRPVHCPWRPIADALGNKPISEAEFSALTAEQTWGFTRDEFIGIVDKYAEVLAVPILSELGGSVLGVLSLDVPKRLGLTDLILDSDDAEAVATAAVALIRDDLKAL